MIRSKFLGAWVLGVLFTACTKDANLFDPNYARDAEQNIEHAKTVLGESFDFSQDWSMMVNGSVEVTAKADFDIAKVQVLAAVPTDNEDGDRILRILNEAEAKNGERLLLTYDAPSSSSRLYVAFVGQDGRYMIQSVQSLQKQTASVKGATTRAMASSVLEKMKSLPQEPTLAVAENSYARDRKYPGFENDKLYHLSEADEAAMLMPFADLDYDDEGKATLRDIILTYLPNKVSNIERIRESKYYNANSYPLTTGTDPVIIEPIYRNDRHFREVEGCDLYYYYFKEDDLVGKTEAQQVQFFKDLPKYRAIDLYRSVHYGGDNVGIPNDVISKKTGYALIYWGEGTPVLGETKGSYTFPEGYRIGFMLRNSDVNGGKDNHHGELYCDGRLNTEVNKWKDLKSSNLGDTDPRMTWMFANNRFFLCCESGTDRDFNDVVFEIEGGVDPLVALPQLTYNVYTFAFEDRDMGDYDLNDVVVKAQRLDTKRVKYSLEATGANDQIFLRNINGKKLNGNTEVHALFNKTPDDFVNTVESAAHLAPIQEVISVSNNFSFTDPATQLYIYNATKGYEVRIAQAGEDPHAILIPYDFKYPCERNCVIDTYLQFNKWGAKRIDSSDWYAYPVEGKYYTKSEFK